MNVIHVENLKLAGLEPYLTLRRPEEHYVQGIFVAEGDKVVRRLLQTDIPLVSLLLTPEWLGKLQTVFVERLSNVTVYLADKKLLHQIVGFDLHQGVMAVARIPSRPDIFEWIATRRNSCFLVAFDGLNNAVNIGVMVRNAAAFGVEGIIVGPNSSHPYLRRAVRNSMGAIFHLPIFELQDLVAGLQKLKSLDDWRLLAADVSGELPIEVANFEGNICLIFGNEEKGISHEVKNICDARISIPMPPVTDSLNVSSANAVFLYEAWKQRKAGERRQ